MHPKPREANRKLAISWNGTQLTHCPNPVYLGATLDHSLTYKMHVEKMKAKVSARNNILTKLGNSRWCAHPSMLHTTALALCYSCAEYACPVWERSAHAKKLDPALNNTCRCITGCLKPTDVNCLYLLSGIAPPNIRRGVASAREWWWQLTDERHLLFDQQPPNSLKSRRSVLATIEPIGADPKTTRIQKWQESLWNVSDAAHMEISPEETLPPGADDPWIVWWCLNQLRTRVRRCRVSLQKWGYSEDAPICECGLEPQTMEHLYCNAGPSNKSAHRVISQWAKMLFGRPFAHILM